MFYCRMFSKTSLRGSQQARPLPKLRRRVFDVVPRSYGRQLERNHEGIISIVSLSAFRSFNWWHNEQVTA